MDTAIVVEPITAPTFWVEVAVTRLVSLDDTVCCRKKSDGSDRSSASNDVSWSIVWIVLRTEFEVSRALDVRFLVVEGQLLLGELGLDSARSC